MVYSGTQQPALLYMIPCLFFTTFVIAGARKEWGSKLSIDSHVEGGGFKTPRGGKKVGEGEDGSARGMQRFDPKLFKGTETEEFKKFEDEGNKEEVM